MQSRRRPKRIPHALRLKSPTLKQRWTSRSLSQVLLANPYIPLFSFSPSIHRHKEKNKVHEFVLYPLRSVSISLLSRLYFLEQKPKVAVQSRDVLVSDSLLSESSES